MAITPSFTISQSALTPGSVTANDTSAGTYDTITQRRIFFETAQGTYLVQDGITTDYEAWALADASDTWGIMDTDHALAITVQWLNVSNVVVEELTQVYCLREFNKNFLVYLGQLQAATPGILQNQEYAANIATYWAYVQYAETMVSQADIANSQNLLDKATYMMQNESIYFG